MNNADNIRRIKKLFEEQQTASKNGSNQSYMMKQKLSRITS